MEKAIETTPDSASNDCTVPEIESRMAIDGFPEIRWLWRRFVNSTSDLNGIDEDSLAELRRRHMGALTSCPLVMVVLSVVVATACFFYLDVLVLPSNANTFDRLMQVLFCLLGVYLFWFLVAAIQRNVIHPWKAIASTDLAAMLKRRSYRQWLEATAQASRVVKGLRDLGINELWDNPDYRVTYSSHGGTVQAVRAISPTEAVQTALQDVLGRKVDRVFQPGRYFANLKQGKKSVSRFIEGYRDAIAQSRADALPTDAAITLLTALRAELEPGSAGDNYLAGLLNSLNGTEFLAKGTVQASIWRRDPWVDLTHSQDFYSSASLPGSSLRDRIERRSKGMLGPFGYLRNKSISALDFSTSDGRCVRARIAAARNRAVDNSEQSILFVDAVEGRFDIKPALIRRAIEDYGRAAGFRQVLYYMFPLNRVPLRFVNYLASANLKAEEIDLAYVGATSQEYLDAFGLPLEPFEYAYPQGRVIGYSVSLDEGLRPGIHSPGWFRLLFTRVQGKSVLWSMLLSATVSLAWVLYRVEPQWLLPCMVLFGGAILYETILAPHLRWRTDRKDDAA